jgi:hypothetical protein
MFQVTQDHREGLAPLESRDCRGLRERKVTVERTGSRVDAASLVNLVTMEKRENPAQSGHRDSLAWMESRGRSERRDRRGPTDEKGYQADPETPG